MFACLLAVGGVRRRPRNPPFFRGQPASQGQQHNRSALLTQPQAPSSLFSQVPFLSAFLHQPTFVHFFFFLRISWIAFFLRRNTTKTQPLSLHAKFCVFRSAAPAGRPTRSPQPTKSPLPHSQSSAGFSNTKSSGLNLHTQLLCFAIAC